MLALGTTRLVVGRLPLFILPAPNLFRFPMTHVSMLFSVLAIACDARATKHAVLCFYFSGMHRA